MRICIFEDHAASGLDPLVLTRPVFELLCGQTSLAAKHQRYFSPCEVGVLIRPYLVETYQSKHPRLWVNDLSWLRSGETVLVNGRWLPPAGKPIDATSPCVGLVDGEVAYAVVSAGRLTYCSTNTLDDCLETWRQTLPPRKAGGSLVHHPWDLVERNPEQIGIDFGHVPAGAVNATDASSLAVVGPRAKLFIDPTAQIEPMVLFDTTRGPIIVESEAMVAAFSRVEGPCVIGPGTQVLGAKIRAGTTLGPQCRVGGEIEASIIHGFSNKYHEGFLGHSYLGEWVNLAAGTHNSDLRNDYGKVTVRINGLPIDTGLKKVGCFLGDHTKTGLGTLLNTGTSVGMFCNLLPSGRYLPRYLPSFTSWWNGEPRENTDLVRLLQTARTVMERRDRTCTVHDADLFRHLLDQSEDERRRFQRESEQRQLRRSA
ncbi:MAG: putative sugar nucleotidyl transferase [Gemmataceae bacterium]